MLFLIGAVAIPTVPRKVDMRIRRKLDRYARFAFDLEPALALPAGPEARLGKVSVLRYGNGNAGPVDLSKSSVALPSKAGCIQIGIRRNLDSNASLIDFLVTPATVPATSIGGVRGECI